MPDPEPCRVVDTSERLIGIAQDGARRPQQRSRRVAVPLETEALQQPVAGEITGVARRSAVRVAVVLDQTAGAPDDQVRASHNGAVAVTDRHLRLDRHVHEPVKDAQHRLPS